MFSERSHFQADKNQLTLLLETKKAQGVAILDLTGSNPTSAGFQYPEGEILAALAHPGSLRYQPSPTGLREAREAIAEYYDERGFRVVPEDILLTASTSEAYAYLFKLLADPGDEVHIPSPSYPLFDYLAWAEGIRTVPYPLLYTDAWHIDVEELRAGLSARTRALLTVTPNNPTGSYLKAAEWQEIRRQCLLRQIPLICDEVFHDYPLEADAKAFEALSETEALVFVLNGLSKIAGLPQLKLGWIVLAGPERQKRSALERLEMIADTFLSVGTPIQLACRAILQGRSVIRDQIRSRTADNLRSLRRQVTGTPAECLRVEGGWYAIIRLPRIMTEEEWTLTLLGRHNVLVHPGYFYDFYDEPYVVVSLITPPDVFREGISRLVASLD